MRHVFVALVASMFLLGVGSVSSALDLDMKKITGKAEETRKEATEKAKDMAGKAEEKKDEGKDKGMMGDIKAKGKEMIKEKIDGM